MKKIYGITIFSVLLVFVVALGIHNVWKDSGTDKTIKVGFVYVGDASTSYTNNFIKAQNAIENQYGEQVETIGKYNVLEGKEDVAFQELIDDGCELIFSTSYGYGETAKGFALEYPDIEFCQATCSNANEEPVVENYHTFMGSIYQGRYLSGVVAGMKLQELIDSGAFSSEQAKVGYVGAYPLPEVISGYTAFLLGIRSVVPEATMVVKYTNTWSSYALEKKCAEELINEGCIIISQHSDTSGPAVACENTDGSQFIYHVGYNESMAGMAPTTYLTGCKINWEPYVLAAVQAVLSDKDIEKCVGGNINGNDAGAGFEEGWVEMLELNEIIAAKGTQEKIEAVIEEFKDGNIQVFQGDYTGVNPNDETDTYDLKDGYVENENSSAPTFGYILENVITIEE